jgi:tetratricopeptide (TPR) repeat protein
MSTSSGPHSRRSEQPKRARALLRVVPVGLGVAFVGAVMTAVGVIAAILAIPDHKASIGWLFVALAASVVVLILLVVIGVSKSRQEWREKKKAADEEWRREEAVREEMRLREEEQRNAALRTPIALVDDIDPTRIGVDAAVQTELPGGQVPEYLPRRADDELRLAVRAALDDERWIVVATGPSKTGKSRARFEALRHVAQRTSIELVAPRNAAGLRLLTRTERPGRNAIPTVLWSDDLEPFVNEGVTLDALCDWHATVQRGLVATTFGGKGSELVADSDSTKLATLTGQILQQARRISVPETAADELTPLRSRLSSEALSAIDRHGLAAYLVAAQALEDKLSTRRHLPTEPESPEGVAIVFAAVDWARCGRTDSIATETLRDLWPRYLLAGVPATDANFDAGLDWALRRVAGRIALLQHAASYRAYEYIVRFVADQPGAQPPRDETWARAIDGATDALALAVGIAAFFYGRYDDARNAWIRARQSSVREVAASASINLGVMLGMLGRAEEALGLFEDVIARFGEERALRGQVATAMVSKGLRLGELGRGDEALAAFDDAITRLGDAKQPALRAQVVTVMINRGVALGELGRGDEALAAFDDAIARLGDAKQPALRAQVATAMINKGVALSELGREDEALAAFDDVITRLGGAEEPALREAVLWASRAREARKRDEK